MKRQVLLALMCLFGSLGFAQNGTLKGKVTDSSGIAVEAATIMVENTKYITSTDSKGNYKISDVPVGSYSVIVEIEGYNSVEQKITITENQVAELNFNLLQKVNQLHRVDVIRPFSSGQGMGHMPETYQGVDYSGLKTEVLTLDSLDADKAQDNFRETLGRLPGSNYSETEGGGFPSNGIAFRGLIPTQSVDLQTRQNGYNISADVYGYPESYYLPPLVAVDEIQVVTGEASLQYGPQFGGVINYKINDGPLDKPLEIGVEETYGSYNFTSSVLSLGGTYKKWHYYTFGQFKHTDGWRPNGNVNQVAAFAKLEYDASDKFKIGIEYTLMRNLIHMSGGLTDAEFNENPDQSFRARNWLSTPWNILTLTADYKISDQTELILKSTGNMSARYLVWKGEEGGPQQADSISAVTGMYQPRAVDKENFLSSTNELRLLTNYSIGTVKSTLAGGVRFFQGGMWQEEEGLGTTGSNYDLTIVPHSWQDSLYFTTTNVAVFIENTFHFGRLAVTPGFRYEYIQTSASGFTSGENLVQYTTDIARTLYVPLFGCALEYKTSDFTNLYGNIVQGYQPTTYENLAPIGFVGVIDPNLQDEYGYNSDLGWRGRLGKFINFDIDGFYLFFNNEIGFETRNDLSGNQYEYETNVGEAVHKGIESYVEIHVFKIFPSINISKIGDFSFFNSYAYDDARYTSGPYVGNLEELAPVSIERIGINYRYKTLSVTALYSYTSMSYQDANNTVFSPNAEVGLVPAYHVVDFSSSYKLKKYNFTFGISNLLDTKYFNFRANEYPGPGIIPAPGRNFYVGISTTF
ncbi:MAG TPA: TonB-dependent receptor [Bacteroidia bacterium]|jgi:Fe(3+) dicitrate transport protein|nr:TonB-dependent receptor [Bacteroidia bacterium]